MTAAIDCENFELGEIVWGKIIGYPWWPAKVVKNDGSQPQDKDRVKIVFFGDHSCAYLNCDKLRKYPAKYQEYASKAVSNKKLRHSICEADSALVSRNQQKLIAAKFQDSEQSIDLEPLETHQTDQPNELLHPEEQPLQKPAVSQAQTEPECRFEATVLEQVYQKTTELEEEEQASSESDGEQYENFKKHLSVNNSKTVKNQPIKKRALQINNRKRRTFKKTTPTIENEASDKAVPEPVVCKLEASTSTFETSMQVEEKPQLTIDQMQDMFVTEENILEILDNFAVPEVSAYPGYINKKVVNLFRDRLKHTLLLKYKFNGFGGQVTKNNLPSTVPRTKIIAKAPIEGNKAGKGLFGKHEQKKAAKTNGCLGSGSEQTSSTGSPNNEKLMAVKKTCINKVYELLKAQGVDREQGQQLSVDIISRLLCLKDNEQFRRSFVNVCRWIQANNKDLILEHYEHFTLGLLGKDQRFNEDTDKTKVSVTLETY